MINNTAKFLLLNFCVLLSLSHSRGQSMYAYGNMTADSAVRNYLMDNKDATISNVAYTGSANAMGMFTAFGTTFPLSQGLILSTGSIYNISGPNLGQKRTQDNGASPDPDLEAMINPPFIPQPPGGGGGPPPPPPPPPAQATTDAAVMEFDLTTSGTSIYFNFVFGSEEYPQAVDSFLKGHDFFAIFVTGPGFDSTMNLARIPGSMPPPPAPPPIRLWPFITAGMVNNGDKEKGPCSFCSYYTSQPSYSDMDGFAGAFNAILNVQPCQTYHIKIAITDNLVDSGKYDSYLFVNAGALCAPRYSLLDKYKVNGYTYLVDNVAYAGCDYAEIRLERSCNVGSADSVKLTYGGTASPGTDYIALPSKARFAQGQKTVILQLQAKPNSVVDENNPKTVTISVQNNECGYLRTETKTYYIKKNIFNFELGNDTVLCEGQSLVLDGTNYPDAQLYIWDDGTMSPTYTVTKPGKYTIRERYGTCMKADNINVSFVPLPKFTLGPDTAVCDKSKILLKTDLVINDTTYHYLWYDNTSKQTNIVDKAGDYWLKVTRKGCSVLDTINVKIKPLPLVNIGPDTAFCYLGPPNYSILALTDPLNKIDWNIGVTTPKITVYTSGSYFATVTGPNGCKSADTMTLKMTPMPDLNLVRDTSMCTRNLLRLTAPPGYTYKWSTGSRDSFIVVADSGTYSVIATNKSCIAYDTSVVHYKPTPLVQLQQDTLICPGSSVKLYGEDPMYPMATYLWSNGSNLSTYTVKDSAKYWVAVTLNGCVGRDTFNLGFKPLPYPDLGKDTGICYQSKLTLSPGSFDSYAWPDGSVFPTYVINNAGSYWVWVSKDGCFNGDTIKVDTAKSPPFKMSHDTAFCEGGSLTLDVKCDTCTYLWGDGSSNPTFHVNTPDVYTVMITNPHCVRHDTITVSSVTPYAVLGADTFLCQGQSMSLHVDSNMRVVWSTGSTNRSIPIYQEGTYWANIDLKGCRYSDTVDIEYVGPPEVDLGEDRIACAIEKFELSAANKGYTTYVWSTGETTPSITPKTSGLYSVSVNRCGVTVTDQVNIDFAAKFMKLYVPNAFTPDGNGLNDEFMPGGKIAPPFDYTFGVYNRWGEKIFETNDFQKGWNGTKMDGKPAEAGVYTWRIDVKSECYFNDHYQTAGNVTLLR